MNKDKNEQAPTKGVCLFIYINIETAINIINTIKKGP